MDGTRLDKDGVSRAITLVAEERQRRHDARARAGRTGARDRRNGGTGLRAGDRLRPAGRLRGVFDVYRYPSWEDWEPDPDDAAEVPGEDFSIVGGIYSWASGPTADE
jgi:hypothetical protein